jgi:hypothetical protein
MLLYSRLLRYPRQQAVEDFGLAFLMEDTFQQESATF